MAADWMSAMVPGTPITMPSMPTMSLLCMILAERPLYCLPVYSDTLGYPPWTLHNSAGVMLPLGHLQQLYGTHLPPVERVSIHSPELSSPSCPPSFLSWTNVTCLFPHTKLSNLLHIYQLVTVELRPRLPSVSDLQAPQAAPWAQLLHRHPREKEKMFRDKH